MRSYFTFQITDGIVRIPCPLFGSDSACGGQASSDEISALVTEQIYQKYLRFKANKENPNNRDCPKCNKLILADESTPEIICDECGENFCFFHGNAHTGSSCQAYAVKLREADR